LAEERARTKKAVANLKSFK